MIFKLQSLSPLTSVMIVLVVIGALGCKDPNASGPNQAANAPDKNVVVREMIKGAKSQVASLLKSSNGVFDDISIHRDGIKDGVVFEFVFAESAVIDRAKITSSALKPGLVTELRSDPNMKIALGFGVYMRYIYKTYDGTVLSDLNITADDL